MSMKNLRILFVILCLGLTTRAAAQFGMTSGYQLTHFSPSESTVLHGFRGGLIYNLPILGGLSIEPGVLYAFGTNAKMDHTDPSNPVVLNPDTKLDEHFIHVPVHAKLRISLSPDVAWILYGGPTFAFGIKTIEGHKKRDLMAGVGTGVEFGPVIMHAGYDYGLGNRLEDSSSSSLRRGCFHVGISFYFNQAAAYSRGY